MSKFCRGDFVRHKDSTSHDFQALAEMPSVPSGHASLYRCSSLNRDGEVYNYHEADLYKVTFSDDEMTRILEKTSLFDLHLARNTDAVFFALRPYSQVAIFASVRGPAFW